MIVSPGLVHFRRWIGRSRQVALGNVMLLCVTDGVAWQRRSFGIRLYWVPAAATGARCTQPSYREFFSGCCKESGWTRRRRLVVDVFRLSFSSVIEKAAAGSGSTTRWTRYGTCDNGGTRSRTGFQPVASCCALLDHGVRLLLLSSTSDVLRDALRHWLRSRSRLVLKSASFALARASATSRLTLRQRFISDTLAALAIEACTEISDFRARSGQCHLSAHSRAALFNENHRRRFEPFTPSTRALPNVIVPISRIPDCLVYRMKCTCPLSPPSASL